MLAGFAGGALWAGDFSSSSSYAVGDVLVCFRNGVNDLVVDAGQVSTLTSAAPNQRIPLSPYYSASPFDAAFGNANSISWSAFTWFNDNTLFVSKARTSSNKQTSPWVTASSDSQNNTVLRMQTIPPGANANLAFNGANTSTAVIEQDSSVDNPNYPLPGEQSYHDALFGSGAYGPTFYGTFQGNPEGTTLGNFTTSGTVARSDFYRLTPSSGNGTFIGYFEMATDGTMTYVAYPSATPVFKSISHSGSTATINYTTGLYGTYTLRGTNTLSSGVAATNWPAITTLTSGDISTHTYMDTDSSPNKFYIITAQ